MRKAPTLTTSFDNGLMVVIEPPELEMRVAILMRKAELEATQIPEDLAFFVAKNVRANVRELEGALRKILASSLQPQGTDSTRRDRTANFRCRYGSNKRCSTAAVTVRIA